MQSVFRVTTNACPISPNNAPKCFPVQGSNGTIYIEDVGDQYDPSPPIDSAKRQAAFDASVFWTLEDLTSFAQDSDKNHAEALSLAQGFMKSGGVIRATDAYEYDKDSPEVCTYDNPTDRKGFQGGSHPPWLPIDSN
jgi:hypothetical protein